MFSGKNVVVYYAPDLAKARDWYQNVLGIAPSTDENFYAGFTLENGCELGLDPNKDDTPGGNAGAVVYWQVPDAAAALERLLASGATTRSGLQAMGPIHLATVLDPFGNILGLIQQGNNL